jgi:transcriptional regulator with XRE-family HTH domain
VTVGAFRGEAIREELKRQRIKVIDFAADVGVARETMFNYLNGSRVPDLEVAGEMAKRLGWPLERMLGR